MIRLLVSKRWLAVHSFLVAMCLSGRAAADDCATEQAAHDGRATADSALVLAQCHDAAGRFATSYALYQDALNRLTFADRPDDTEQIKSRLAELDHLVARLTLDVENVRHIKGLRVTLDGRWVPGAVLENEPVDPGPHEVAASAPGYDTTSVACSPLVGERLELYLPSLNRQPQEDASAGERHASGETQEGPPRDQRRWRVSPGVYVAGGASVAFGVGAAITGVLANKKKKEFDEANSDASVARSTADSLRGDALRYQYFNAATLVGALLGAGVATWLFVDDNFGDSAAAGLTPWIGPTFGGLSYGGRL